MKLFATAYAHCDVPCGIYETDSMRHSAHTCKVMVEKILPLADKTDLESRNAVTRMIMTKEKHAERVKRELCILWGDYFKPEHLERFPELHETIWKAVKVASAVKQSCDLDKADELISAVHEVEHLYTVSKQ